jgi:hypothetical protein
MEIYLQQVIWGFHGDEDSRHCDAVYWYDRIPKFRKSIFPRRHTPETKIYLQQTNIKATKLCKTTRNTLDTCELHYESQLSVPLLLLLEA